MIVLIAYSEYCPVLRDWGLAGICFAIFVLACGMAWRSLAEFGTSAQKSIRRLLLRDDNETKGLIYQYAITVKKKDAEGKEIEAPETRTDRLLDQFQEAGVSVWPYVYEQLVKASAFMVFAIISLIFLAISWPRSSSNPSPEKSLNRTIVPKEEAIIAPSDGQTSAPAPKTSGDAVSPPTLPAPIVQPATTAKPALGSQPSPPVHAPPKN